MTLTFPREMPSRGGVDVQFTLERQEAVAPEQGGRLVSVEIGLPRWRLQLRTGSLSMERLGQWRAFLDSLRGAGRTFFGYDPARRYPLRLQRDELTTDGGLVLLTDDGRALTADLGAVATAWTVNSARDEITLTGLAAGFVIAAGDMLDLSWSTGAKRSLHRCVESVTATDAGAVTVQIEPPVPAYVPAGALASFDWPRCVMRLVPGSVSVATSMHRSGTVSFEALQHLEA